MPPSLALSPADDSVLRRLEAALQQMYGDRIVRMVLFGSRARGEAHAGSELRHRGFPEGSSGSLRERFRLANLRVDFLDETGAFTEAQPFPATAYADRTALMHATRTEGLDL